MKLLNFIAITILLIAGNLYANDDDNYLNHRVTKDYQITIASEDLLKVGENSLEVSIRNKTLALSGLNVQLNIITPKNEVIKYNNFKNNSYDYNLNLNLPNHGKYNYTLYFNQIGGIVHQTSGSFTI